MTFTEISAEQLLHIVTSDGYVATLAHEPDGEISIESSTNGVQWSVYPVGSKFPNATYIQFWTGFLFDDRSTALAICNELNSVGVYGVLSHFTRPGTVDNPWPQGSIILTQLSSLSGGVTENWLRQEVRRWVTNVGTVSEKVTYHSPR